ncbi:galactonate dehydratase [Halocatena marina]|uniref:galactonate dehydratase n=1 Tax=Halocatena marina TaxID=2934937 RepID=UPI0022258677|nr:galactonate dehydratase [Halocatena marina]
MHITDFELFSVSPRWLLLKVTTSDGTVGWGEPIVQGRIRAVSGAVKELMDSYLIGEDPLTIEKHWETMYRGGYFRGGPVLMSAIAGIDMALWDIMGHHYDAPIYDLLGGPVRSRLRVHHWIGGEKPEDVAASAREMVEAGYSALKINATAEFRMLESPAAVNAATERLKAMREAVGDSVDIGVDFHGRVSFPMAKRMVSELEPFGPMYFEQPVLPEQNDRLREIAAHTAVPVSTGERLYSRWDFKNALIDGIAGVFHPDVTHVGGISEMRKIATMTEAFDVALVPHCPIGPVALAASLQVGFCSQNIVVQEQSLEVHDIEKSSGLDLLENPTVFEFEDGYLRPSDRPGLGIDLDESTVRELAEYDVNWHNPIWHHDDGSPAEW